MTGSDEGRPAEPDGEVADEERQVEPDGGEVADACSAAADAPAAADACAAAADREDPTRPGRAAARPGLVGWVGGLGRAGRQVAALAGSEVRLGLRRRWVPMLAGLFAAFGLGVLTFAGSSPGPAGFARILASLASLCVYLVPLAALAYGYSAVVGPAERGWLEVLFALPVSRSRVLLGTALGRATVLTGGLLLGFALPGVMLVREYGLARWPSYATVVLAVVALGLAFLSIGVLLSTLAREKTHALGAALLAWVWFVLVHDLLALGLIAALDLSTRAVAAMVLANPASAFRVLVLSLLGAGGSAGFAGVVAGAGLTVGALAGALAAWTVLPVAVAAALLRVRGPRS